MPNTLTILMPVYNEARDARARCATRPRTAELPRRLPGARDRRRRLDRRDARAPATEETGRRNVTNRCYHERNLGKGAAPPDRAPARDTVDCSKRFSTPTSSTDAAGPTTSCSSRCSTEAARASSSGRARGRDHSAVQLLVRDRATRSVTLRHERDLQPASSSDVMTCHKAMSHGSSFRSLRPPREAATRSSPRSPPASFAPASGSTRCRSRTPPRSREEGKKLTALDGLRVLGTLVRCRVD